MIKSRCPFFSILSLGVFVYFWKEILAYLYPHRFSQVTHYLLYLTEVVLSCKNSQAYLPCIYYLIKTGSEEGNVILLDQRLWKLKTCQLLLAYCLLEGPWAIIFFLFYFFLGGYRGTPNSTAEHLSIFSTRLSSTCSFLFPRNILIFA